MYPSGGNNAYGSQPYASHQTYGQMVGAPGTSLPSQRLSGIFGSSQQTETGVYRGNISGGSGASNAAIQYGGQYGAYTTPAVHQGLSGGSYSASPSRGQYGQNQGAFNGRDLLGESGRIYSDHVGLGRSQQSDPDDQISFFRQQQLIHSQKQPPGVELRQSLVDSPFDGSIRAADYLAARGASIRHESQDYGTRDSLVSSYGMRTDVDPGTQGSHQLPGLALRAAVGRSLEGDAYARGSSGTSYGVTLPPGRDYSTGKVLGSTPSDVSYRGPPLPRKEERSAVHYKMEEREEELRRDRERDRERGRLLERRERERDREHTRPREIRRRDRTPPRSSRVNRASPKRRTGSLPVKRSPPRLHRHPSPVKERRRGYTCKVTPHCLVEVERDLSSVSRRYPRLSISPEFSKLVLRWPKEELDISFFTPVTFEHDCVETSGEAESKEAPIKPAEEAVESGPSQPAKTVWNAKVILMSGISTDALSQLVSERSSGDKVVHINSILRFALFREGRAFNAIGGSWNAEMDGGDPSAGDLSLIRTAIRCTKELVQVDLTNCLKWTPFLEVHYDRVSKDGLCSYKEVTVLFLPDLENCLPSVDVWRSQWISRREARVEREREAMSKKKKDKNNEKKDDVKGNPAAAESVKSSKVTDKIKKEKDDNKVKMENDVDSVDPKEVGSKSAEEVIKNEKVDQVKKEKSAVSVDSKADGDPNSAEKVKKRTREDLKVSKSEDTANSATKVTKAKVAVKVKKVKAVKKQVPAEGPETSTPTKPVKKVTKLLRKKPAEKDTVGEVNNEQGPKEILSEEKTIIRKKVKKVIKKEPENAISVEDVAGIATVKQTGKKVVKESKPKGDQPKETKKPGKVEKDVGKVKEEVKQAESLENNDDHRTEFQKEADVKNDKLDSGAKNETKEKVMADIDGAIKGEEQPVKVKKDKGKSEEPPQFPGLFLQAKRSKDSNVRSTTLSLDGLLDYNENDIEESTFELSLFAEALYEMFQFKMGCCILSFLEKLGESYLKNRSLKKREREENSVKQDEEKERSKKRSKFSSTPNVEDDSAKPKTLGSDDPKSQEVVAKIEDVKSKQGEHDEQHEHNEEMDDSEEEDPEEEPVEDDDDDNEAGSDGNQREEQSEDEKMGDELLDSAAEKDSSQGKAEAKQAHLDEKSEAVSDESSKQPVVDKELLQAFRFFDREWVGYIKVDDLRTIIHNLGKFHSKRAVKELLRIAVQESNKDRDGRIYYTKFLKAGL